jgi:hypothetical protein
MASPDLYGCEVVVRLSGILPWTQSLIFEKVNLIACICCLNVRLPIFLKVPLYALD